MFSALALTLTVPIGGTSDSGAGGAGTEANGAEGTP
jgi:hypothetical protein